MKNNFVLPLAAILTLGWPATIPNAAAADTTPPTIVSVLPLQGSVVRDLFQIEVIFSEPVDGVDASDLLVNGVPASGIVYGGPDQFAFDFPRPATGTVTIAFAPGHGIQDRATVPNAFAGASWNYTFDPNAGGVHVVINEFMAANSKTLHDEDGDSSDWIELYNSGDAAVNLKGYYLSDQTNLLSKWRFPDVTIAANGYLVVFASGKNRTNNPARLHTNFQLSSGGEYLALSDPTPAVISEFAPAFPPQQTDVSYGRDRLNPDLVGFFTTPTPGAANATSGAGFAPEVQFSRNSGTFALSSPFALTLSTPSNNAAIYYTLGTNLPGTNSILYTAPIPIANSTLIQARAFATNLFPGPISTRSYVALADQTNVLSFRSTLPIMILHNLGQGPVPVSKSRQFVVMQTFEPKSGFSSLTNEPDDAEGATFHVRGSSTAVGSDAGKASFFFKIQDAFQDKKTIKLLGLPEESDWVLYAPNNFEPALFHNPLAHSFAHQQGEYSSRTRFFELYLKDDTGVPGPITSADYYGVMVLEEKIKRDKNRVDIAKLEPEHLTEPEVTGGYMFSIDRSAPGETQLSAGGAGLNWVEPDYSDVTNAARAPQVNYIRNYMNSFNSALMSPNWTNPVTGYAAYIDVDSWVTRHIHEVITFNVDALRLSGYFFKDRSKKIQYGPAWDYDRTQGSTDGRDFNPRIWRSPVSDYGTDFFNFSPWWYQLFKSPDFWQRWIDRYQELRQTVYSQSNVERTIDEVAAQVREAQPRERARWNRVPRRGTVSAGGFTYNFGPDDSWENEVTWKKVWYSNRLDFIDGNFLNRPTFNIPGGVSDSGFIVTLSGPPGVPIYYTLDGSDPRASGGGIAESAFAYGGPIVVTNNARIVARCRDLNHMNETGGNKPPISSPWSGSMANTFKVRTPRLVVTELMYHPAPPASVTDTNDPDNFEFIELQNVGSDSVNLVGFRFINGIEYTFTAASTVTNLEPGGYVLIVKDLAAFTARYGVHANVAGEYAGSLDNGGERLTLVGPFLETVLDFEYSDNWYPLSDGFGFSLVINNPNAPVNTWSDKTSWRQSSGENGSPGILDPAPPELPIVLVNEALTHTDFVLGDVIELFNPGNAVVNIGGWYLTDDPGTPKKYQIPANTVIPPHGFALFDETNHFDVGPNAFALGSSGDNVYLFSATNGLLSGYAHGFGFGAADNGVTFGRYVNSQGAEQFVAQALNTLGVSNSLPRVGPVVISEIMYHPPETLSGNAIVDDSIDEFIELYNITATNVALFNSLYASNTWRLTSAVDFDFPTNVSIAPSSFALVVNFDPATNAAQVAAFRARYSVSPSIPLFGPFGGKLDNSGESIRLRRPDNTTTNGTVPYILVDQIDYRDDGSWPGAADGAGASLQRLVLTDYGNDPTNWVAARPTAGAHFQGGTLPTITLQPVATGDFLNGTAAFTVAVTGAGTTVQWRLNGDAIPGATNTTLTLSNIQYADYGSYDVVALNSGGAAFSSTALLSVRTPVTFFIHPVDQNVQPGTNVTLVSSAFSSSVVHYQWQFEGVDIPGATNATYSFTNASLLNHGTYRVIAVDDISMAVSSNAFIFVLYKPGITLQPVNTTNLQWQTATFSVIATGAPPLSYRWIRQGVNFLSNAPPTLVLTNIQPELAGSFRVVVTNLAGSVNSASVKLVVIDDMDADGLADFWETNYFGNTIDGIATADVDGDGMSNLEEYLAGTDPLDPLSVLKLTLTTTNAAVLQFVAQTNVSYTLQFRTNLTSALWNNVTSIAAQSLMQTIQVKVPKPPPEPARFYRVVTPAEP